MSKLNLLVAVCAAALACSMNASEAHAQSCPWQAPSPVVMNQGSYESGFVNCAGQSGGTAISARVWINSGAWTASVRRSLICGTTSNVGILVAAQVQDFFSGAFTTRYRRGAAPSCSTTYTTASSLFGTVTRAACQVGFGSGCLPVTSSL